MVAAGANAYAGDIYKDRGSMSVRSAAARLKSFQRLGPGWLFLAKKRTLSVCIDPSSEQILSCVGVKNVSALSGPHCTGNVQEQWPPGGSPSVLSKNLRSPSWKVGPGSKDSRRGPTIGIGVTTLLSASAGPPMHACSYLQCYRHTYGLKQECSSLRQADTPSQLHRTLRLC